MHCWHASLVPYSFFACRNVFLICFSQYVSVCAAERCAVFTAETPGFVHDNIQVTALLLCCAVVRRLRFSFAAAFTSMGVFFHWLKHHNDPSCCRRFFVISYFYLLPVFSAAMNIDDWLIDWLIRIPLSALRMYGVCESMSVSSSAQRYAVLTAVMLGYAVGYFVMM